MHSYSITWTDGRWRFFCRQSFGKLKSRDLYSVISAWTQHMPESARDEQQYIDPLVLEIGPTSPLLTSNWWSVSFRHWLHNSVDWTSHSKCPNGWHHRDQLRDSDSMWTCQTAPYCCALPDEILTQEDPTIVIQCCAKGQTLANVVSWYDLIVGLYSPA